MDTTKQIAQEADLILLAQQAGFEYNIEAPFTVRGNFAQLQAFARILVEGCTQVAESYQDPCTGKAIASEVREHFSALFAAPSGN
jgi:hypothetical protein